MTDRPGRIILWRHGRTEWNAVGRGQGQLDVPLDDIGRRQARLAAPYLAALRPDAIVASDLSRAVETAAAASESTGLPVGYDARLREIHLGAMQGLTRQEARVRYPAETAAFEAGDSAAGGRESPEALVARSVPAVLETGVESLLVVSHGGTIRAVLNALLGVPRPRWRSALGPLGNCRWSELRRRGDGWQLVVHNTGPDLVPDDSLMTAQDVEPARGSVAPWGLAQRGGTVATCTHLDQIRDVEPDSTQGCPDCLAAGSGWVHLRECLECGHVGCCDSSPKRHATAHFQSTSHPVMRSFEPGESWRWCFVDEAIV